MITSPRYAASACQGDPGECARSTQGKQLPVVKVRVAGCPASLFCALNCTCPLCSRSRELFVTAIVTDLPLLILPLLGLRLTSDEPKDLVTVERHCTLCGPLLANTTVVERPSP